MKLSHNQRLRIFEQAALQLIRLQERDTEGLRADFVTWSKMSAHHVHELLFAQAVSRQLDGIDAERTIDVDSLPTPPELIPSFQKGEQRAEEHAEASQAGLPTARPSIARRRQHWRWAAGIAGVTAVLSWIALGPQRTGIQSYATTLGEQRSVKLSDGSVMVLNTSSRTEVRFSKLARQIELVEGEALFMVRHDAARPFQVSTESGTIVAVGTQFNVYKDGSATHVSVIEGAVRVSAHGAVSSADATHQPTHTSAHLNAGDEVTVNPGRVIKAQKPDVQRAVAWRARQLMFRDSPLAEVAEEFNRYNKTQIVVEGSELRARSISGVFDADDTEPLIDFLAGDPRLSVQRSESAISISAKRAGARAPH